METFKPGGSSKPIQQIAFLGSSLPRQCGIATYTDDLARSISEFDPTLTLDSIAMSDKPDYIYPERVCFEIHDGDVSGYLPAAEYINRYGYDILSVQHEYGIYGGSAGAYLLNLVREAKMPVVTTLHTVLREPNPEQKQVMDEILQLSQRVVVMSEKAIGFLARVHQVNPDKIDLIPHGIPFISEKAGASFRNRLGIEGPMILTFGLLSQDKGVQYAIEAMPKIIARYPGAVYVIVGATHPNVRAWEGEAYRESLQALAKTLGVEQNVRFVNRFVATEELVEYLGAMDIYITPYLNAQQITSGTLAYSVGAGKAVISTPYAYAEEILAEGRGILVPFRSADAIAEAVINIQSDPAGAAEMGQRAARFGEKMLWPAVAESYLKSFQRAREDSANQMREILQKPVILTASPRAMPDLKLDHLYDLSDDTGILQHATFTVPNRGEGYCVDDNARALLLTAYLESEGPIDSGVKLLQSRYLSFVMDAYNPEKGRFKNFMTYGREWLELQGSEDSHGRSLWALGAMAHRCRDKGRREASKQYFERAAPAILDTTSPRTWAYGVIACEEYLAGFPHEYSIQLLKQSLACRLWRQYEINQGEDWPWFEQSLSYANARLSQSLILAGDALGKQHLLKVGLESLEWLMNKQTGPYGVFAPIGSDSCFIRGGEKSLFDQQPVECAGAVSACLSAYKATQNPHWITEANRAFRWFLGENMLGQPIYDRSTGGCNDGLHAKRVNRNQGAESTLSFLCALTELRSAKLLQAAVTSPNQIYETK